MTMTTEHVAICRSNSSDKKERLRKHSDDITPSKHIKRSECMPLSQLEDLITCPIHLGMMEDPRILSCGHVFCLDCLQNCITSFGSDFRCPVCRKMTHVNQRSLSSLPPSIQTRQLIDCIMQAKAKLYEKKYGNLELVSTESVAEAFSLSLENKRDLVKHLLKEIAEYTKDKVLNADMYASQLEKVLESIESPPPLGENVVELENAVVHSTNQLDLISSNYELMDVETIRENMKKYCEYKPHREINHFLESVYSPAKGRIVASHFKLTNEEPEILAWSCSQSNMVMVKASQQEVRTFTVRVERAVLKPKCVKIYNNLLYVSGVTRAGARREKHYHLVQCSLLGEVVRRAVFTFTPPTTKIAGFHIEQRSGKVLVALPTACKVAVLSRQLLEDNQGYQFADLHPRFVSHSPECGEIWATCPEDGRILIIDEESGSYRQLGTGQIYNAVPSDIIVTSDNRVLFLDCHANRVFWVRKRNEFILIQRVSFVGHGSKQLHARITSMHAVCSPGSNGKLLLTTANRICLVRPAKIVGEHHPRHLLCSIL